MKDYFLNGKKIGELDFLPNISKNSDVLEKYFLIDQKIPSQQFYQMLTDLSDTVSLLKYIAIDSEFKKQGFATKILKEIILNSNEDILLISEAQDDFLIKWYEKYGFKTLFLFNYLPVMILKKK